jgi:regulator of RNase E activity RraA
MADSAQRGTMANDVVLFEALKTRLFTAVVGDVLDRAGFHHQFLPPQIRPLRDDMVAVGRAMPVLQADIPEDAVQDRPGGEFGLMFRALDDLKPGEIYVCAGGSPHYALWGGLMSTRAMHLGATGAVLGGCHRDTREILALGFPVFSSGAYAQDQRGRGEALDFRVPIVFANGCRVAPGDIVFGDLDGIVVIPKDIAGEIVQAALVKLDGEEAVRQMIVAGGSTEAIFAKTGIM